MLIEVKVPVLPESITEATLVNWHKKAGEAVSRDENLIDIETDKVVLELPAPSAGVLTEIRRPDGSTVTAQEVIAVIDTDGKGAAAATTATAAAPAPGAERSAAPAPASPGPAPPAALAADAGALPAARKLMAEEGIHPGDIAGTGRGGRVTKGDVLAAVEAKREGTTPALEPAREARAPVPPIAPPAIKMPPNLGARPEQRVPMSRLRQRVAERLVQSQSTAAILTTFNEVDCSALMDVRRRHRERFKSTHGVDLGFMSLFARAVVLALADVPVVNARIDGDDIVYNHHVHLGIAVSTERGLVVPVIRHADAMRLAELERAVSELAARAREARLMPDDLAGGTFSMTNGGVFGSLLSTPILNPPQSGILGMHKIQERPVAVDGQVVVRPMMYVALSYDHRLVDGQQAVTFLVRVKERLEDPVRMLLEV